MNDKPCGCGEYEMCAECAPDPVDTMFVGAGNPLDTQVGDLRCNACGTKFNIGEEHPCPAMEPLRNLAKKKVRLSSPLETQVGGSHYKDLPIQPVEYIHANGIGYLEGNVIKYVSRWRAKNGIADLEKAKHYIDLLIDLEKKRHA